MMVRRPKNPNPARNGSSAAGVLFFVVHFLLSSAAWSSVSDVNCQLNDELKPVYELPDIPRNCLGRTVGPRCSILLRNVYRHSEKIRGQIKTTCESVADMKTGLANAANQQESALRSVGVYESTLKQYQTLNSQLNEAYVAVRGNMESVLGNKIAAAAAAAAAPDVKGNPKAEADKDRIRDAIQSEEKMKSLDMVGVKRRFFARNDTQLYAGQNGFVFMKNLLKTKKEANDAVSLISGKLAEAKINAANMARVPDPKDDRTPDPKGSPAATTGSGLDMKALMGLATAGMGLAQMMKKPESKITDDGPSEPTPPAATAASAAPSAPEASKFNSDAGKKEPSNPIGFISPELKKDVAEKPGSSGSPAYNEKSDISAGLGNPTPNTFTPAKGGPPGGGGGSGGGSEGGDSARSREPSAATAEKREEEAMQGIGGGGLSGAPSGSSSDMPMDPDAPAMDDSMKDLLNDMTEAAEGGEPAAGDMDVAADTSIPDMDSGDLFPRVRACIVRSLKQGKVLNGLGDRIQP